MDTEWHVDPLRPPGRTATSTPCDQRCSLSRESLSRVRTGCCSKLPHPLAVHSAQLLHHLSTRRQFLRSEAALDQVRGRIRQRTGRQMAGACVHSRCRDSAIDRIEELLNLVPFNRDDLRQVTEHRLRHPDETVRGTHPDLRTQVGGELVSQPWNLFLDLCGDPSHKPLMGRLPIRCQRLRFIHQLTIEGRYDTTPLIRIANENFVLPCPDEGAVLA